MINATEKLILTTLLGTHKDLEDLEDYFSQEGAPTYTSEEGGHRIYIEYIKPSVIKKALNKLQRLGYIEYSSEKYNRGYVTTDSGTDLILGRIITGNMGKSL